MKLPLRNTMLLPMLFSASVVWALPDEVVENNVDTGVQTEASEAAATPEYVEGEVIVRFKTEGLQAKDITALQDEFGVTNFTSLSAIGMQLWEISGDTKSIIEQLNEDERVEYAEPNFIIKLDATPDDTDFEKLWGLNNTGQTGGKADADIDALEAWGEVKTPTDTVVAVIDTGVDYNHSDLAANMWKNEDEIPDNGKDDDGNGYVDDVYGYDFHNNDADPMDDHYHGTHVAGTIAAVGNNANGVIGVNPNGKIMALKFLSASGSGTIANAIRAVDYAANNGAKLSNNSWGCSGCNSSALYDAIRAAGEKGHLFIAAAGNAGSDNDGSPKNYPSSYDLDNIIAVAATDHNDDLAYFSSYGATSVDLGAPGVDIYSTAPGDTYRSLNGTSMATPHVAGAVSLILSECADLESNVLKQVIMNTTDPVASLDGKTVTGGRLNVHQALLHDAMKVCRDRDTAPPPSFDVCGEGNIPELHYTSNKANGKFGDIQVKDDKLGYVNIPFIALPLIDPITGRYTDVGIFRNANLNVHLRKGTEDFDIFMEKFSSKNKLVKIWYKKDFYDKYFGDLWKKDKEGKIVMNDPYAEPSIERRCYALYTYENKTLHLPIAGIPTYAKLPNDDIVMVKGKSWYGMSLIRSAVDKSDIDNTGKQYKTKYVYRIDYNTLIRVGDDRLDVEED